MVNHATLARNGIRQIGTILTRPYRPPSSTHAQRLVLRRETRKEVDKFKFWEVLATFQRKKMTEFSKQARCARNYEARVWKSWSAARWAAMRTLYRTAVIPASAPRSVLAGAPGRLYLTPLDTSAVFEKNAVANGLMYRNSSGTWEVGDDIVDITANFSAGESRVITANEEIAYAAMCCKLNALYPGCFFMIAHEYADGKKPSLRSVM